MRADGANILAPGLPSFPLHRRSPGDWDIGKLYPVTAAQLLPIIHGIPRAHLLVFLFSQRTEVGFEGISSKNQIISFSFC
jgi:hypothetical protein